MGKKTKKATGARYYEGLPQIRANAAGIDIGASEIWVDVGNKDTEPVRQFETFTADLEEISGNNKVWRQFKFGALTTSAVRVWVTGALASYSRITEVEAYGQ